MSEGLLETHPLGRTLLPITPSTLESEFSNLFAQSFSSASISFRILSISLPYLPSTASFNIYGTIKKYFALVCTVDVPGKKQFAKASLTVPIPSSSTVPCSLRRLITSSAFCLSSFEKSIHPNCIVFLF